MKVEGRIMATVTITNSMPQWQFWANIQGDDSGDPALITNETKTNFSFTVSTVGDFANWSVSVDGAGFKYLANDAGTVNEPTAGSVTSFTVKDDVGATVLSITGASMELVELYYDLF